MKTRQVNANGAGKLAPHFISALKSLRRRPFATYIGPPREESVIVIQESQPPPQAHPEAFGTERRGLRPIDLRVHTRRNVELDVGLDAADGIFSGFLENLSLGGAFVATHMLRPVGEVVQLSVYASDGNVLFRGTGEVRWLRNHNEVSDLPPGMGVQFLDLEGTARSRVASVLQQAATDLV